MSTELSEFSSRISEEAFLSEIHRLLWIEPVVDQHGVFDPGWSCRDHTLVLGNLAVLFRLALSSVDGLCIYMRGGTNQSPPVALGANTNATSNHRWLETVEGGIIDLSPNLGLSEGIWRSVPKNRFSGIVLGDWLPAGRGRVVKCLTRQAYDAAIAEASNLPNEISGIYLPLSREPVSTDQLADAFQSVDSPLSNKLRRDYGPGIYAKAVIHLRDFLRGEVRGLAGVSRSKAWQIVNSRKY